MHIMEANIKEALERNAEKSYCVSDLLCDGPDFPEDLEFGSSYYLRRDNLERRAQKLDQEYKALQRALILASCLDIWNGDDISW
jgi:hypothetical protein